MTLLALGIFIAAYVMVLFEEATHLRKSKPVMLAAGLIWLVISLMPGMEAGALHSAVEHTLSEFAGLMLFLLAAMTFIAALEERGVFDALRARLIRARLSKRALFWATGWLAFFLSPLADNMTTALVMGAVVVAVDGKDKKFISLGCINIVCAANAGGAFSPFGDITTLMVWQAGKLDFLDFFHLFAPAVASYIVPALLMSFCVGKEKPVADSASAKMKPGALALIALGIATIAAAVVFEQVLHLPAWLGMMTGLSLLMIRGWHTKEYDAFQLISRSEWDTLLFFFGVIFCLGGLSFIGLLETASRVMYGDWGATSANIAVGFASAILDNIPIMFAVLKMNPAMNDFQWLLITLTAGIGGSLLSIGSAAGVALMGTARGHYTFLSHLKWTPVIFLGYAVAIGTHFWING